MSTNTKQRLTRRASLTLAAGGVVATSAPVFAARRPLDLRVEDFRVAGRDDRATVRAALAYLAQAGSGTLRFEPNRRYWLGELRNESWLFHLRDLSDVELIGNNALLVCRTGDRSKTIMFLVQRCKNLTIRDFRAGDLGARPRRKWTGMDFVHCETGAGPISDFGLRNVEVNGATSLLTISGRPNAPRAAGFVVRGCIIRNSYYGINCQENGDLLVAELRSERCRRAYIAYGVSNHRVALDISSSPDAAGGNACILIKRYQRDTTNIAISARFSGTLRWAHLVKLEHQPPENALGLIAGIDVTLDLPRGLDRGPVRSHMALSSYRGSRLLRQSDDVWRGIAISGCLMSGVPGVEYLTRSRQQQSVGLVDQGGTSCPA